MAASDLGTEWKRIITGPGDLITTPEATQAGFSEQAGAKALKARPIVDQYNALRIALQNVEDFSKLLEISSIKGELATASGISQKARKHLSPTLLNDIILRVVEGVYNDCVRAYGEQGQNKVRDAFCDEVLVRYLLTSGATLDGKMRNWTGNRAQDRLLGALVAAIARRNVQPDYSEMTVAEGANGMPGTVQEHLLQEQLFSEDATSENDEDEAIEEEPSGGAASEVKRSSRLAWPGRLLLFNVTLKPVSAGKVLDLNNIDMVLLRTDDSMNDVALKQDASKYLACGELKGGIDPAGADEHWKTARTSFDRIESEFNKAGADCPMLFFVGAAIAKKMAGEIFDRLSSGKLSYAANLTSDEQLDSFADWLVSL